MTNIVLDKHFLNEPINVPDNNLLLTNPKDIVNTVQLKSKSREEDPAHNPQPVGGCQQKVMWDDVRLREGGVDVRINIMDYEYAVRGCSYSVFI